MQGPHTHTARMSNGVPFVLRMALVAAVLCGASLLLSSAAQASFLGLPESADWSDMAFPSGVSGSFDFGSMTLMATGSPSNDLEIGSEFGPGGGSRHYGSGGTLGGAFSATLSVTGVVIQPDGTVNSGDGGILKITHEGSSAGSLKDDYADTIHAGPLVVDTDGGTNTSTDGDVLLEGSVLEVLLNATGDNTLDVLFSISGGALQYDNPALGTNFAPANLGILRIAGVAMPDDFSSSFDLTGATIDVLGIPEPSSITLALFGMIAALACGRRCGAAR